MWNDIGALAWDSFEMSSVVHKRNRGADLKSACRTGTLVLAMFALSGASTTWGEMPAFYSCASSLAGRHGICSASAGSVEKGRTGVSGLPITDSSVGRTILSALQNWTRVASSTGPLGAGLRPVILPRGDERAGLGPAPTGVDLANAAIDGPPSSPDTPVGKASVPSDTSVRVRDSLPGIPTSHGTVATDSSGPRRAGRPSHPGFFPSPTGTLLKSVAFPGWGQWSNGKKKKAAVYFGIETYFLMKSLIWRHRTFDRLHEWERTDPNNATARLAAFNSFDSARNSRNYFYWLTGITVFISMFDAYSDSYLLTLECTRKMGDEYWGGQALHAPDDEVRVVANWRF